MPVHARRYLAPALVLLAAAIALLLAYANKARCTGPVFDAAGRSESFAALKNKAVCYSDIQLLWLGRGIDTKVFPYIHGGITPDGMLGGGSVEYPVLSGLLMWLGALPASNDAGFLLWSSIILAPFGLATAWLLARLAGWRALLFAAAPALVMYGFHNWDLAVVLTAVAAVFVVLRYRAWGTRKRALVAAVILAIGFCVKIYPGFFLAPLALWALTGGDDPRRRWDAPGAVAVAGVAALVVAAINAPFAVLGFDGWRASFEFQSLREADITTNSIWYWGLRPLIGDDEMYDLIVGTASPALVLASFAAALAAGWWILRRTGEYPWVAVSATMLCGFLLLHKVHSPQFMLWLLPFLVLLRVPWTLIGAYMLADLAIGIGVFRYFHDLGAGIDPAGGSLLLLQIGVWGRAAGLVLLAAAFLVARPAWSRSCTVTSASRYDDQLLPRAGHRAGT
ncbi:glycosyltransferase 87 family protein [Lolliginicoccus suaedae]|uniref:glycosyltransferase 87 family protein n=1 Tax=Lolliginicoccus suaedae TaxID=2605429 RepID=UPI0011EEA9E0|nr:glycosyltransferase 87 family protein [Lolliginicoccus suaedae]